MNGLWARWRKRTKVGVVGVVAAERVWAAVLLWHIMLAVNFLPVKALVLILLLSRVRPPAWILLNQAHLHNLRSAAKLFEHILS